MRVSEVLRFYERRGYRGRLGAGVRPAVLVVDFSRAFTEGESAFPGGNFGPQVEAAARLVAAARPLTPVVFTTLSYDWDMRDAGLWVEKVPWLRACQSGSPLVEIDPALGREEQDEVIVKKYPSAFFGTGLHQRLRESGVDTLLIAGCTTSVCIRATALDAMQHGYRTLVVREAVGDFDPAIHELHLADIGARYCDVVELEDVLAYLGVLSARG